MILNIVQYQYWVLDLNMAQCQYGELELEHGSASIEKVASIKNTRSYLNFLKKEIMYSLE